MPRIYKGRVKKKANAKKKKEKQGKKNELNFMLPFLILHRVKRLERRVYFYD